MGKLVSREIKNKEWRTVRKVGGSLLISITDLCELFDVKPEDKVVVEILGVRRKINGKEQEDW